MRISIRATKNWASTPQVKAKPHTVMRNGEFKSLCAALKIADNATAAELFGLSWRTCQRYWYDELAIPGPLARLLRAAVRHNLTQAELRSLAKPIVLQDNST